MSAKFFKVKYIFADAIEKYSKEMIALKMLCETHS